MFSDLRTYYLNFQQLAHEYINTSFTSWILILFYECCKYQLSTVKICMNPEPLSVSPFSGDQCDSLGVSFPNMYFVYKILLWVTFLRVFLWECAHTCVFVYTYVNTHVTVTVVETTIIHRTLMAPWILFWEIFLSQKKCAWCTIIFPLNEWGH